MLSFLNFKNFVLNRTEVNNLRAGMFPDQEETKQYLSTISPFVVRDFFRFMEAQMIDGCAPYSGKLAAQLYVLSRDWSTIVLRPSSFAYRLSKLSAPRVFDLFAQLPTESQEKIWEDDLINQGFGTTCTAEAYISLLLKTDHLAQFCYSKYEKVQLVSYGEASYLQVYYWNSEENRWSLIASDGLEIKSPSREFFTRLTKVFQNTYTSGYLVGIDLKIPSIDDSYSHLDITVNFGNKATEGSVMLLELYGEEYVTELLKTATESKINLCLQDVISILETWQENREYPLSWILHTAEGRHNHSEWKL